jgi:Zn-dependent M28 family amino/carboxypeptidase
MRDLLSELLEEPELQPPRRRRRWPIPACILTAVVLLIVSPILFMTSMPGKSFSGALPSLSSDQKEIAAILKSRVWYLAETIGERNVFAYPALQNTAEYVENSFKQLGYQVMSQEFTVQTKTVHAKKVRNLIAVVPGSTKASEIVVLGAHYDTADECPGADDNSSGVAALLELARLLKDSHPVRTIKFVAFVNEEPPWFQTENMGSLVYARQARAGKENIVAAISLEAIGAYSDQKGSQNYPAGFGLLYPSKGNFISFIGNISSRGTVRQAVQAFRKNAKFPSEGAAVPASIVGVGWSDHWSFWQAGYPSIMVTDTAPFRNKNYHLPGDQADTLDYDRMARVVDGLKYVVQDFAR